nr:hypothetical protein CFP56_51837 [Quercus suber]
MVALEGSHVVTGCESACLYRHSATGSNDLSLFDDSDNQSWHSPLEIEGVSDLGRARPKPCATQAARALGHAGEDKQLLNVSSVTVIHPSEEEIMISKLDNGICLCASIRIFQEFIDIRPREDIIYKGSKSACLYRHSATGSSDVSLSGDSDEQS